MAGPTIPYFDAAADENVKSIASASRAELYMLEVSNPNANDLFLQLFDVAQAADVNLGTTKPTLSFLIPSADAVVRGAFDRLWTYPIHFRQGIHYAITTTPVGAVAPAAACNLNAGFLPRSGGQ